VVQKTVIPRIQIGKTA